MATRQMVDDLRERFMTAAADLASEKSKVKLHKRTIRQLEAQLAACEEQNAALLELAAEATEAVEECDEVLAMRDEACAQAIVARERSAAPDCTACTQRHVTRERLPVDRIGKTFKLRIGDVEQLCKTCFAPLPGSRLSGHLTLNRYPDGRPGELFLSLDRARRGDLAAVLGHQLVIAISAGLQFGIPLAVFAKQLRHVRDDSGGYDQADAAGERHTVGGLPDLIALTLIRAEAERGVKLLEDKS